MVAYADDTQLIIEADNITQLKKKIEQVITTAQKWYRDNSMKNNIAKTEILLVNPSKQNEKMKLNIRLEYPDKTSCITWHPPKVYMIALRKVKEIVERYFFASFVKNWILLYSK